MHASFQVSLRRKRSRRNMLAIAMNSGSLQASAE
jgi:hypothetical protein